MLLKKKGGKQTHTSLKKINVTKVHKGEHGNNLPCGSAMSQ